MTVAPRAFAQRVTSEPTPEVRKRDAQALVKAENAGLVACHAWLGRVIVEVVGEQGVEERPITAALYFFGIAADDGFRLLADILCHGILLHGLEFKAADGHAAIDHQHMTEEIARSARAQPKRGLREFLRL